MNKPREVLFAKNADRPKNFQIAQPLFFLCLVTFFFVSVVSPPPLMDDVDSVTAQIARTMVETGDWVTPRLNGIVYFEKPALRFWIVCVSYLVFGVHDWAARIPIALAAVLLCWVVSRMGRWAFDAQTGTLAGIVLATSVGLFLFTRILLPDVVLTLTVTLAVWSLLRALDEDELKPRLWAAGLAVSLGLGVMLKGLVALVLPLGAGFVYLLSTKQLLARRTWQRLRPFTGVLIIGLIGLPWITLSIWQNPPYFDFTMKSEPGKYRGFFWFFFLNEHLFRYLNLRYPRDYNTVPRGLFWLYHLLWLFPWSVYFPLVARLGFKPTDRARRLRLLCLGWVGFTLLFFTFSTTQEYYSMPCYPALALLLGVAMRSATVKWPAYIAGSVAMAAAAACGVVLWLTRNIVVAGDISSALVSHVSTLSLGKVEDLTLASFAWLRVPLVLALSGFLLGAIGAWWKQSKWAVAALAVMMLMVFNAARLAMVTLNPNFGSQPLAAALLAAPPGQLIVDDQYYAFSSVFFYANRPALLLNGRKVNLEYGSYRPDAPQVFLTDAELPALWQQSERKYMVAYATALPRLQNLLSATTLFVVQTTGGKLLLTNQPLANAVTVATLNAQQKSAAASDE
jgi:4-amino-4-deoxy-L-arabinose transferase-like glycosyltransferase